MIPADPLQCAADTATAPATDGERPLRVLTVLTFYRPHWTGLTRFAQRIAEALAASGAEVRVLTSRHTSDLAAQEVLDGVAVRRLETAGRLSRALVVPGLPRALWQGVHWADVVHLHSPMAEALMVTAICRLTRTPLVVTHQGDVVMPAGVANRIVEQGMRVMLAVTFRSADRVVTHNDDYLRNSLTRVAGPRAMAIEPPVPFRPPALGAAERFRARHGLTGVPVVAFAGRWVEEKGFDVLLRAAPLVLAARPDARFVFAGERNVVYESFSDRCQPMVEALGSAFVDLGLVVDESDFAAFLGAADVFVLPSRTDCHASVQVEAMLCGTPVVASDIAGARSVVQATGAGVLAPVGDERALASAIVDVLGDPDRFAPALAGVASCYDPDDAIARYRDLLGGVVSSPRRASRGGSPPPPVVVVPADQADGVRTAARAELAADLDNAYRHRVRWMLDRLELGGLDGPVLDAGCGLGNVTHLIERSVPGVQLAAIDPDPHRLGAGRRQGVAAPLVAADGCVLPFGDDTFAAVVCSEVLEHVDDADALLRELQRVLRPGGQLLVSVPHADFPWTWDPLNRLRGQIGLAPVREGVFAGVWTDHRRLYRPDDLTASLRAADFEVEDVEEQTTITLPFAHLALYGVGRGLVDRGWVQPDAASAGRPSPRPLRALVDRLDRPGRSSWRGRNRFVSIVAAARAIG